MIFYLKNCLKNEVLSELSVQTKLSAYQIRLRELLFARENLNISLIRIIERLLNIQISNWNIFIIRKNGNILNQIIGIFAKLEVYLLIRNAWGVLEFFYDRRLHEFKRMNSVTRSMTKSSDFYVIYSLV